jgi:CheY-like chemotaxis protein
MPTMTALRSFDRRCGSCLRSSEPLGIMHGLCPACRSESRTALTAHPNRRPTGPGRSAPTEARRLQATSHRERPAEVLVVDDQKDLRDTTAAILGAEGYAVVEAADGVEALERLRRSEIAVMLLDLGLPRMDGPTLLEQLDEPPAVVVLSAFGEWSEAEIRTRFASKVVECLHKPVTPSRLLAATAAAFRDHAPTG